MTVERLVLGVAAVPGSASLSSCCNVDVWSAGLGVADTGLGKSIGEDAAAAVTDSESVDAAAAGRSASEEGAVAGVGPGGLGMPSTAVWGTLAVLVAFDAGVAFPAAMVCS